MWKKYTSVPQLAEGPDLNPGCCEIVAHRKYKMAQHRGVVMVAKEVLKTSVQ